MSHVYNDSVVYVRNGKPIPAIVLSSLQSDRGELLTVLYAQPEIGPTLLAQGTTRGIAQVQQALAPFVEGNTFGWEDTEDHEMRMWKSKPRPTIAELEAILNIESDVPIVVNPDGSISSKPTAPEQLDEVQGPVEPGAPASPHAIDALTEWNPEQAEKTSNVNAPSTIEQTGGQQGGTLIDGGDFGTGTGTAHEGITIAPKRIFAEGEPGSTSDNPLPG